MNLLDGDLLVALPAGESLPRKKTSDTPVISQEPAMTETAHSDNADEKAPSAFRTISEAAKFLNVPQHVLRFWESRFSQIKPLKLRGGRRYYRPEDIETLSTIKGLLYKQGYTIDGAKKAFSKDLKLSAELQAEQTPKPKAAVSDKQKSQLTVVRHELVALRDILKPYLS